jgi:hypothetical protein
MERSSYNILLNFETFYYAANPRLNSFRWDDSLFLPDGQNNSQKTSVFCDEIS